MGDDDLIGDLLEEGEPYWHGMCGLLLLRDIEQWWETDIGVGIMGGLREQRVMDLVDLGIFDELMNLASKTGGRFVNRWRGNIGW